MGSRRKSREHALEILYQMDIQKQNLDVFISVLNDYWELRKRNSSSVSFKETQMFTAQIIKGVLQNQEQLDSHIQKHLRHWPLSKVNVIDRNIIRIALYEMLHLDDIPSQVTINEAIELAKKYASQESYQFVNGILDNFFKDIS
ncbi:transcription antitermination factor NusB [PVC group bacterium (ex Bugula neritina AB1)]|nr:transcription antitermination factor NusB [PVC group bacterium (ex Bugula neritina AB1)]